MLFKISNKFAAHRERVAGRVCSNERMLVLE
jgi:hypothetical protein